MLQQSPTKQTWPEMRNCSRKHVTKGKRITKRKRGRPSQGKQESAVQYDGGFIFILLLQDPNMAIFTEHGVFFFCQMMTKEETHGFLTANNSSNLSTIVMLSVVSLLALMQ